jgi:hypothetical protein
MISPPSGFSIAESVVPLQHTALCLDHSLFAMPHIKISIADTVLSAAKSSC